MKRTESHPLDCVIHFAALKSVGQSVAKPLEYYANNVTGSANLLEVIGISLATVALFI